MRFLDFHTHPFCEPAENIKAYKTEDEKGYGMQRAQLESIGVYAAAGSVIIMGSREDELTTMHRENAVCMRIFEEHGDFFIPGIRVNPHHMQESCETVEKAYKKGVRLIGELTPHSTGGWKYTDCGEIFDLAQNLDMVVSCHPTDDADMCRVCEMFPHLSFVFAHPGEKDVYMVHLERIKKYENAYLDISGTGLFRNGMLKYGVQTVGADRILFGTDYPICNPGMYTGGVLFEGLSDTELTKIAYKNAERLLGR